MKNFKILHFDDDEFIGQMYGLALERAGFEHKHYQETPGDPEELISFVLAESPDLIISDVIRPGISGFEIIKILKQDERTKNIPFAFLTNLSSESDMKMGKDLGAVEYWINAETTPDGLVERVRGVVVK